MGTRYETAALPPRHLAARERFACLPEPRALSDFDSSTQPGVDGKPIRDLAALRYPDDVSKVCSVLPCP